MNRFCTLLLVVLLLEACASEKAGPGDGTAYDNDEHPSKRPCLVTSEISSPEMRNRFPFNQAHSVVIGSFENYLFASDRPDGAQSVDEVPIIWFDQERNGIYVTDSVHINRKAFREYITLSKEECDNLGHLMFNYRFADTTMRFSFENDCYNPRHAIIFLDKKQHVTGIIEICFECARTETFPASLNLGDPCPGKMDVLKSFFTRNGIKNSL